MADAKDCYFYTTRRGGESFVAPLCLGCHGRSPGLGWFWPGSSRGYGPFEFRCEKCGTLIYEPSNAEDETQDPATPV